ncbi:MAG: hypothetical protein H0X01_07825 [Nitrospira sp.]|nr:hypothetical protein [Nitrospira sp.]
MTNLAGVPMDKYEIHLMRHPWNGCGDPRPWVIVDFPAGRNVVGCLPVATQCYGGDCFYVSETHPDFDATGLDHSSNIIDEYIIEVPGNSVIRYFGVLTGSLLQEFKAHTGL